jgi:hypothetical protein
MVEMAMIFSAGFVLVMTLIGAMHYLRRKFPAALTEQQQNTMIGPFSFIATLYAFLIGFVVVTLWHNFTEAGQVIAREAESITVLHRLSDGLPDGHTVQKTLLEYVRSVREDEWPAMAEGMMSKKTEAVYLRLWEEGRAISPTTVREQVLHSKFVDELSNMSYHRRERIILNERELPRVLWGALLIGGLLLLVGLFFLSISTTGVQVLVDVMVIGMLLIMFYLAVEFSGPFRGDVRVSPSPLETLERNLMQQQR